MNWWNPSLAVASWGTQGAGQPNRQNLRQTTGLPAFGNLFGRQADQVTPFPYAQFNPFGANTRIFPGYGSFSMAGATALTPQGWLSSAAPVNDLLIKTAQDIGYDPAFVGLTPTASIYGGG